MLGFSKFGRPAQRSPIRRSLLFVGRVWRNTQWEGGVLTRTLKALVIVGFGKRREKKEVYSLCPLWAPPKHGSNCNGREGRLWDPVRHERCGRHKNTGRLFFSSRIPRFVSHPFSGRLWLRIGQIGREEHFFFPITLASNEGARLCCEAARVVEE